MEQNERQKMLAYIDDLMKATSDGRVIWKAVNPTTFVWESSTPPNAKLNFQRVERVVGSVPAVVGGRQVMQQRKQNSYFFQAFDLAEPSTAILSVDSSDDSELNQKFNALFELIKTGISEKSLEFLRRILPK